MKKQLLLSLVFIFFSYKSNSKIRVDNFGTSDNNQAFIEYRYIQTIN